MNKQERWTAFWLASVFSLRMLGLFMILPVFALYAEHLRGHTPILIGLAIGIYGLSQALFQIPFGFLSDHYGRKRIIYLGLIIFSLGSLVAAMADSIHGVIIGRALQGSGAISAAVMALAADLTREQHRIRVMATIGITIGLSFAIAMILGPLLDNWIGVSGIFWLTGILALLSIGVIYRLIPDPVISQTHRDAEPVASQFSRVLSDRQLLRLDLGIFTLHLLLTATFLAVPLALRDAGLPGQQHWKIYLPVLLLSMALMIPFVILAEKYHCFKSVLLGAIITIMLTELGLLSLHDTIPGTAILLLSFFTSFNILEATLPSLITKIAPAEAKGTAMGIYSSSQFFGAFTGGAFGGVLYSAFGIQAIFIFAALSALIWLSITFTMAPPRYLSNYLLNIGICNETDVHDLERQLTQVNGVEEAAVIATEGVAYLKVDQRLFDETALLNRYHSKTSHS
ncbi:MAG: MFS transporter [Candidatus Contendobacter odensis]|uniref:MFS transporter n=1 Tax=Candidatus Contendibacter odensensis TaxID=1400860 RepID=A0A2G6PFN0_9GAMM|nr:MAG: MFS transporter [Candidatus Contendobacter odensis]